MVYGRRFRSRFKRKSVYARRKYPSRFKRYSVVGRKKFGISRRKSSSVWTAGKVAKYLQRSQSKSAAIGVQKLQEEVNFWKAKAQNVNKA